MKSLSSIVRIARITLFCIVFIQVSSFPSAVLSSVLMVQNDAGLLSLKAKDAPIEQVFEEISKKFDVYVKIYPEMKRAKISANFRRLSLVNGIKRLVKENYAIVTRNDKIQRIYILNKGADFQKRNLLLEKLIKDKFLELNELKALVLRNVRKESPHAKLFALIPHEDIRGDLQSYAFCFYVGKGNSPTRKEIEKQVQEAWEFIRVARKKIEEGYKSRDSSKIIEWMEKSKKYDHMLRRNNEFVTLEVSASYDSPPIKSFYRGIALDIAMYPNAVELLTNRIGKETSFVFNRTFRLDPLAIGFEFQDNDNKKYYVDVLNRSVFTGWKERYSRKYKKIDEKKIERIMEQWADFIGS